MRKIFQTIGLFYDMILWGLGGIIVGTMFAGSVGAIAAGICGASLGVQFSLKRIKKQDAEKQAREEAKKTKQEAELFQHRVAIKFRQKNGIDAYTKLTKDQIKQVNIEVEKAYLAIKENRTPDEYAVTIAEYEEYHRANPSREEINKM